MNLTENTIPPGFDPEFALDVLLPLAQAAYAVMNNPGVDPQLPDGYRKTALIEAHPGMLQALAALPASLHPHLLSLMLRDSSIFGLLGNNPATKTAFVSFRGTQTPIDWKNDLDALYEPYGLVDGAGEVHKGFLSVYETLHDNVGVSLAAACQGCDRLLVTGHSMGAALAVLSAPDLARNIPPKMIPTLLTFAGPRAGLLKFHRFFNNLIPICYRVVASGDIVPHVPLFVPPLFMYEHVGTEVKVDGGQMDPTNAHSLERSYIPGLRKLLP